MFLYQLSAEQKAAFVELARRLIAVDSQLTMSEETMLSAMAVEMGIVLPPERTSRPLGDLCRFFDSRAARVAALLELISLAHVDGEFGPEERDLLKQVAGQFEVDGAAWQVLNGWVSKQMALAAEAAELMEG